MLARYLIDLLTLSTTSDHRHLLISTSITYRIHTIVVLFDFTRDNHDGAHTREIERIELTSLARSLTRSRCIRLAVRRQDPVPPE